MTNETKIANIILRLKEVKGKQPELTLQKISDHTGVSFSTVSRIFSDKSEAQTGKGTSANQSKHRISQRPDQTQG